MNAPEVVALVCEAMFEAARAGAGYGEIEAAGRSAVSEAECLDGVSALVDEVRLEVLMSEGTRLVVLRHPVEVSAGTAIPGAIEPDGKVPWSPVGPYGRDGKERLVLCVRNSGSRVIRVSSHFPFHRVNARLGFHRQRARGFRLDLPAGGSMRWAPGEEHEVTLVAYGGAGGSPDEGADHEERP